MTQVTFPQSGSISTTIFNSYMGTLDNFTGFVVPNYWNNLEVITSDPTVGAVQVKSGAAVLSSGIYYTNDSAVSVAITSAANARIDRIVLRAAKITKIIGLEAATPAMPALTAGDLPLAWIYMPAGYNAATTIIQPYYIHDERVFATIGNEPIEFKNDMNYMHNFEFMMFSRGGLTTTPPEMWKVAAGGAPTTCAPYASLFTTRNFSNRSSALAITANATTGITTTIPLPVYGINTYTIRFTRQITANSFNITISNRLLGGGTTSPIVLTLNRISGDPITDEIIRFTTDATANALDITITSNAANSVLRISPILVTSGLCTTYNYPRKSETLMVDRVLQDASWTTTAKSTGTTVINLNASFGGNVRRGTIAVLTRVNANDSGSAGGPAAVAITPGGTTYTTSVPSGGAAVTNLPNDFIRAGLAIVPIDYNALAVPIRAVVTATGAGTLDATIEIVGIIV